MENTQQEQGLEGLYAWIDTIPLTRPKKAFNRDFADGGKQMATWSLGAAVLAAEIVHFFHPRLVQLHNYSAANGLACKQYNWATLNQRVFRSLGASFTKQQLNAAAAAVPGAAEVIIAVLRTKLLATPAAEEVGNDAVLVEKLVRADGEERGKGGDTILAARSHQSPETSANQAELIAHLQQTLQLMGVKISKLEQLLQLKDAKIEALTAKLRSQQNFNQTLPEPHLVEA